MYSFTYISLCSVLLASSTVYTTNLFAGDVVDLGSYTTSIAIGKGPTPVRYKTLTELDKNAIFKTQILINNIRAKFPIGVPPLPALDPYIGRNFPAITLDQRKLPFSGKITVKKIHVTGGKHFILNNIEIRMNTLRTDFDVTIPQLDANTTFDADVQLGGILPITAKGKVRITITGVNVHGIAWATETPQTTENVYSIEGLRVRFHADDIKIQLIKTSLKSFELQALSSSFSPPSKKEFNLMISAMKNSIAREIVRQINNALKKLTVNQIKNYLLTK